MSMSTQPGGSSLNPNSLLSVQMLLQQVEDLSSSSPEWPGSVWTLIEQMRTSLEDLLEDLRNFNGAGRYGHLETVSGATKKHDKNPNHSLPKGKYREKPVRCVRPKCSPRRIIHQPR